jgi:mono/diheme cytochrome c family protein
MQRRGVILSIGTSRRFIAAHLALGALIAGGAEAQGAAGSEGRGVSAFAARKAERLLRDQLSCLGCHSLRGEGGRLGPDLSTVRERRSPRYIAAMLDDPRRVAPGSVMPRPVLPPGTRKLISDYLAAMPGDASGDVALPDSAQEAAESTDGAALYRLWCSGCHGTSGDGKGPNAEFLPIPPAAHTSASNMQRRSDDALYDMIAGGGAIMNRSPRMPAFGGSLRPAEIQALVRHLRALCRCQGPGWSRDGRAP